MSSMINSRISNKHGVHVSSADIEYISPDLKYLEISASETLLNNTLKNLKE
jgi:hypothetical protein